MLPLKLIFYCLCVLIRTSSQVGPIVDVKHVGECREPVEGKGTYKLTLNDDPKSVDFTGDFPVTITEDDKFLLKMRQYNKDTDTWNEKEDQDGYIFEYLQELLGRAYNKVKKEMQPPIEEDNSIPAGKYELKNFVLGPQDVDVPPNMIGDYEMEITFDSEELEESLCCFQIRLTIT